MTDTNVADTKLNLVKSRLAKLLAKENLTVVHDSSMSTAAFDMKNRVVILPVWKKMSEDLYDLLVVHEVGHALETDFNKWEGAVEDISKEFKVGLEHKGFIQSLLNIVEDARIDRLQQIRYPGAKKNYYYGYKELMANDFFGLAGKDLDKMSFADRMNLFFKTNDLPLSFDDEEKVLLRRAEKTQTMDDVTKLTRDIFEFLKNRGEKMEQQVIQTQKKIAVIVPGEGDGEGEGVDLSEFDEVHIDKETFENMKESDKKNSGNKGGQSIDVPGSSSDQNSEDKLSENKEDGKPSSAKVSSDKDEEGKKAGEEDKADGGKKADEKGDKDEGEGKAEGDKEENKPKDNSSSKPSGQGAGQGAGKTKVVVYEFEAKTVDAAEQNLRKMVNTFDDVGNGEVPRIHIDKIVNDYKMFLADHKKSTWNDLSGFDQHHLPGAKSALAAITSEIETFIISQRPVISHMVSEFERYKAADAHVRARESRTGVLDMNRLHTYKFNDDLFKKVTTIPDGKNHGFVIVLDWSGSMGKYAKPTVKQLIVFALFCKRINVPFEVYLFRDPDSGERARSFTDTGRMPNSLTLGGLRLRNVLSSRMSHSEQKEAILNLWCLCGDKYGTFTAYKDTMTGTPLIETAVALSEVVNKFKADNKLQVTNCIIMTDGDPNPHVYRGKRGCPSIVIISDPVTRKTYEAVQTGSRTDNKKSILACMLNVLKDRTGCNLLGYFITDNVYVGGTFGLTKDDVRHFVRDGFVSAPASGFDEYYFVNMMYKKRNVNTRGKNTNSLNSSFMADKEFDNNKKKFVKSLIMRVSKET